MNPAASLPEPAGNTTLAEIHSEIFNHLVTDHAHVAMTLLGKFPHPDTGLREPPRPEEAKAFIDRLEMLEAKTRGNLSAAEAKLLQQMLRATQAAFAEIIESQISTSEPSAVQRPGNT